MRLDTTQIKTLADIIRDMCGDDEVTFLDTLEGETDAFEIADMLIDAERSAEAMQAATKARIAELRERCDRFDHRRTAHRATLGRLLDAIGVNKLERPEATISRTAGRLSVRITDEAAVPSQLCTVKTITTPDKAAIKAQIEAGETVPGAELVRGESTISVRVK